MLFQQEMQKNLLSILAKKLADTADGIANVGRKAMATEGLNDDD